jgi:hypothetical protein
MGEQARLVLRDAIANLLTWVDLRSRAFEGGRLVELGDGFWVPNPVEELST